MGEAKTGDEIFCPYCSEPWECPHLVAVINSMGESYDDSGAATLRCP